jgi:excinuclease ABC subunit C
VSSEWAIIHRSQTTQYSTDLRLFQNEHRQNTIMTPQQYQAIASTIPTQPGIYKYYDASNQLLYVGKAKHLRKRVGSYFTKTLTNYKTQELVQRIDHIAFTIVDSEQDAFLLENALIKQFRPKYNIDLKDDKTFPFIVIKKESFPRVFLTRKKVNDGSEYLGPFTSVGRVRELIEFIKQTIPLRTCKLHLSPQNIEKKKFKVCLEYHLGNCKGPCEGLQSTKDYEEGLTQIKNLLKGSLRTVVQQFTKDMQAYAANLQFEKAEMVKKKIEHLENYQATSVIVSKHLGSVDVFSILKQDALAYVNYLMVQNGTIVQTHTIQLQTHLEETEEEVLAFSIAQLRQTFNSLAQEIVVPMNIDYPETHLTITVPKAGDKKKLLILSAKNVNYFKEEIRKKKMLGLEARSSNDHSIILNQLQADLQLPSTPLHIECFDNSNFQGSFPVSAMVCFKNGLPSKKDYRRYNVKTVVGINDFATMKEVVYRRYKRLQEEQAPFPQLVIIDGGKGQLSAAMESIKALGLIGAMTLVGLAKNEEELFFYKDQQSIKLPYDGPSLTLLRCIRDEVHRFGISFHRNQRSKAVFKNELGSIKGLGITSVTALLQAFKSVTQIKQLSVFDMEAVIGKAKATLVVNYFQAKEVD